MQHLTTGFVTLATDRNVKIHNLTTREIMADNLQKRPAKGILKNSSSFDKQELHPNAKYVN